MSFFIAACQEAHQDKEDLNACCLGCDSQVNIVAKKKHKFSQVTLFLLKEHQHQRKNKIANSKRKQRKVTVPSKGSSNM